MSKPPTTPGTRIPGTPIQPNAGTRSGPPHSVSRLAAVLVDHIAGDPGGTGEEPDAELLRQCAIANQICDTPLIITDSEWTQALLRMGPLTPVTLAGLRAKLDVAFMMLPVPPESNGNNGDIEDWLLWFVLHDVIGIIDRALA